MLANVIVLNTILGKDTSELREKLKSVDPAHELLRGTEEKMSAFEEARLKYTPKFEA